MLPSSSSSLRLGRLSGVPVYVSPGALFIAGLLAFQLVGRFSDDVSRPVAFLVAGLTAIAFLLSILLHEVGHAVVAQRAGVGVKEIRLWFLGGAAALERPAPTAKAEMSIAAAGPAASFALGGATLGASFISGIPPVLSSALLWLGAINLILAAFNSLPALPLDGGRVLTGWLWKRRGNRLAAVRTTAKIGQVLGRVGFAVAALQFVTGTAGAILTAFVSFMILRGSDGEVAHEQLIRQATGHRIADVMQAVATVSDRNNAASARALLPSTDAASYGVVVDDDRVARGVIDLARVHAAAEKDGTQLIQSEARQLGQNDVAYDHEELAEVLQRASTLPVVVIDNEWRPIGIVTATAVSAAPDKVEMPLEA